MSESMQEQSDRMERWRCEMLLNAKKDGLLTPMEEPSEALRIEWAKKFVAESDYSAHLFVDHFKSVEIRDQNALADIARIMASRSGWRVGHFLSKVQIEDEKVRIELAKIVASGDQSQHLPGQLDSYKIQDQKVLVELAAQLFENHPAYVGQNFSKFNIQDEAIRIRFAKKYAEFRGWAMSQMIPEFDLHDQPTLIEIATKNAMRAENEVAYYFGNFRIESVEERIKIAKIVAQNKPIDLMRNFDSFEITDEKDRFEVAKIAFFSKEHTMGEYIHVFDLPNEKYRIELAKISADLHPERLTWFISLFKITDDTALTEIAKIVYLKDPKNLTRRIDQFHIQNESNRFEIAKILAPLQGVNFSDHYEKFNIQSSDYNLIIARLTVPMDSAFATNFHKFKIPEMKDRIELAKAYADVLPDYAIKFLNYFELSIPGYNEVLSVAANSQGPAAYYYFSHLRRSGVPFTFPDFAKVFLDSAIRSAKHKSDSVVRRRDNLSSIIGGEGVDAIKPYLGEDVLLIELYALNIEFAYNEINPLPHLSEILKIDDLEKFIPVLSDRSRHAEVQTKLFQQIWKVMRGDQQQHKARLEGRLDSLNVVEIAVGLPEHSLETWAKLSNDRRNTFYELALEIAELQPGIFLDFPHVRDCLSKKQNEYVLGLIRDNLTLGPSEEFTEILKVKDERQMGEQLKGLFSKRMARLFADLNLSISYDEFLNLKEKWGNLEPVMTLMARFKGNQKWQSELPWLGHVFSAEIHNRFHNLKFSEPLDNKDAKLLTPQLDFLSTEQKFEWQKMRSVAQVVDSSESKNAESSELMKKIRAFGSLGNQLITHLEEVLKENKMSEIHPDIEPALLKKQDPNQTLKELREKFDEVEILSAVLVFFKGVTVESDIEKIQTVLIFLNSTSPELIQSPTDLVQIKADIKETLLILKGPQQSKNSEKAIVYTTLLQDAKNLLTIGDLVEASSCQNYKTGSHVETLLGYVLDANVQGVVSFAVSSSHFRSEKEFLNAYEAVSKNPHAIHFDLYAHTFTIQTATGVIQSFPVKKAHFRQILKLGKTENGNPGLRLERAYQQYHTAQTVMAAQTQKLLETVRKAIGAEQGEITIPQSRNPGGVYSDACTGVMTKSYKIQ